MKSITRISKFEGLMLYLEYPLKRSLALLSRYDVHHRVYVSYRWNKSEFASKSGAGQPAVDIDDASKELELI